MFFSFAGSQTDLRSALFEALQARVRCAQEDLDVVFYDGVPLPRDCKTPIAHQLRIWALLDEWRLACGDIFENQTSVVMVNGFGLDAAWHATRQTSCPIDRNHIFCFQEQLVDLRIKAQGFQAPRYIVVAENDNDPAIAYAKEYCARIPNQHKPFIIDMAAVGSIDKAVVVLERLIGKHMQHAVA